MRVHEQALDPILGPASQIDLRPLRRRRVGHGAVYERVVREGIDDDLATRYEMRDLLGQRQPEGRQDCLGSEETFRAKSKSQSNSSYALD